jgi:large subunit ribosomal protein L22
MESTAKLYNSSYSARKMRLLADLVRGMRADKALFVLKVHEKRMYASEIEKLLLSAISNWRIKNDKGSGNENELVVKAISVDAGRMLKRVQPAPQGRAHRVRKRSNHITIVVSDNNENAVSQSETDNEE